MKTICVKIMGSPIQTVTLEDGSTIADVKAFLELEGNYTFNMNGKPATGDLELPDGKELPDGRIDLPFLVFSPSVKGAAKVVVKATKKKVKPAREAKKAAVKASKATTKRK